MPHLRHEHLVHHLPDPAHVGERAVRVEHRFDFRLRGGEIGVGDDRMRKALALRLRLQPARLAHGIRVVVLGLHVHRLRYRNRTDVAPVVGDEIIAPDRGVVAVHARPHAVGEPRIVVGRQIPEVVMGVDDAGQR